jgi:hypothetical protein
VSSRLVTLLFMALVIMGVVAKLWRATAMWIEADTADGFVWLPLGVGSELVFAGLIVGVVEVAWRLHPVAGGVVAGVLVLGHIVWLTLNDISFRISQIGITWWRLRGDEGLRLRDFDLVSPGDVLPALALSAVCVVIAALAIRLDRRVSSSLLGPQRLAGLVFVGMLLHGADVVVFSERNFGMAENPELLLLRTGLQTARGTTAPTLPRTVPTPTDRAGRLALLRPEEPQPPSTTPSRATPAAKNAIIFFSEGVARKHTGLEGQRATPNLMATIERHGALELPHYYTTYHKSIAAIFSMTCADYPPPDAKNIMEVNPRIDCGAVPEVMAKHGIHPGLFHGGDFGFYDKLQLLGMRGYEIQKDARSLDRNGAWDNEWGIDDRLVVDAMLEWIDTIPPDERFFATYIPITAHYPFDIPPDVEPAFPGSSSKARYLSAVHFLDQVYGRLVQGLIERGRFEDTALVYLADHGETVGERPRAQAGRRMAYEPSLHVPFVVVAPAMFKTRQTLQRVGSHVDLLPTMMDLMGLPPDPRHLGRSLVAADFEPRRVFIGASNGPKYVGFIDGRTKFIVGRSSGVRELYDLVTDPDETNNLAGDFPEKVDRYTAQALAFADGQLHWLKTAPKLPDEVDVQVGLLEHARVQVTTADGRIIDCIRPADSMGEGADIDITGFDRLPFRRTCGDLPPIVLGTRPFVVQRPRQCVLVNFPEGGGTIEFILKDQPWQPFITRVRVAVDKELLARGDEGVVTAFGDGLQGQERPIGGRWRQARVAFPSSSRELVVRLTGEQRFAQPLCVTFTEAAWRKPGMRTATLSATPPPAGTTRPVTGPEDDDEEEERHGRRPHGAGRR